MATTKSTSRLGLTTGGDPSLFLAGRNLAIVTLNELLTEGDIRCSIEAQYRDGQDQCDTFARAIEILRTAPPATIRGFAAVFTEIVGCAQIPACPDYFDRLSIEDMSGVGASSLPRH